MSLGKYIAKGGAELAELLGALKGGASKAIHGEEILGPAGAFKRSGYVNEVGHPVMASRNLGHNPGPEMSGGLADTKIGAALMKYLEHGKDFAGEYPRATAAAAGAGGANLLRDLMEGDSDDDDR